MPSLSSLVSHMQMGQPSGVSAPTAKAPADAGHHLKAAHAAHKAGDHKKAKHHAFAAIKAMPRAAEPDADDAPVAAPAAAV